VDLFERRSVMVNAGTSAVDITPPLGTLIPGLFHERRAEVINDPLYARSFVFEQEGQGVAVVVCDLIGVKRIFLDRARESIANEIGMPPERVLICCTHTHTGAQTGEDAYTEFLIRRIVDSVGLAWEARQPTLIGWGRTEENRVVFNRRFKMRDGTVRTNPGIGNPDVIESAGPVDPEVGALFLESADGAARGLLANYSLHYVGGGDHQRAVSADYFGMFGRKIQQLKGESFVAALSNGACGDINNHDVLGNGRHRNDRYQHTERVAALVAADVFWIWNEIEHRDDLVLNGAMEEVVLTRKPAPTGEEIARAREIEEGGADRMGERAFSRRILQRMKDVDEEVPAWVQALRIGDLGIVGIPGELLVGLGLDIKKRSPFEQTMILELANDSLGYLPDRKAFEEGGYEPEASLFNPGVGEQIVDVAVDLLNRIR
jgi:neutral ceramidase